MPEDDEERVQSIEDHDPPVSMDDFVEVVSPKLWAKGMDDPDLMRCPLCGDEYHRDPDPAPGWGNLCCPGMNASEEDKEFYLGKLTSTFAEWVGEQAKLCGLCGQPYHREQAEADPRFPEVELRCPGVNAREGLMEEYLKKLDNLVDAKKIEDTNWDEFADDAKQAYKGRQRSDGIAKTDLPSVARPSGAYLQEHANKTTAKVVRKLGGVGEPTFITPPAAEMDVPHVTVEGELPRKKGIVTATQFEDTRKETGSKDSDYGLFLKGDK